MREAMSHPSTLTTEEADVAQDEAMSNAELTDAFRARTSEESASMEEPLDTGLWPVADLSDDEVRSLVTAMHAIQRVNLTVVAPEPSDSGDSADSSAG